MTKYVRYGNKNTGIAMYVITMFQTDRRNWKIEVCVCDCYGKVASDPVAWDMFPDWWSAYRYFRKQYKEFDKYVNHRG